MNNVSPTPLNLSCSNSLSWSAIFGGLFSATAVGALFSLLGTAIGLALFTPDTDVMSNLSITAIVWFIVGGTIAMFLGGFITGYLAPTVCRAKAVVHGLVMWSISFILGLFLAASGTGAVLTGSGQLIGHVITISGKVVSSSVSPIMRQVSESMNLTENKSLTKIADQAGKLVQQAAKKSGVNKQNATDILQSGDPDKLIESVKSFVTNTDDNMTQELRDAAIQQITANTSLNRRQAEQALDKWQQSYEDAVDKVQDKADQLKEQAKDAVDYTTGVLSAMTFSAFIAMIFGALATILGSIVGVNRHKNN